MSKHLTEITHDKLKAFCRLTPTLEDCAAFFGCSTNTIERRVREYEDLTFGEFRNKYMVHTRYDLIRKALKQAEKSPAIMIFCLKNLCKWKDKIEHSTDNENPPRFIIQAPDKVKGEAIDETIRIDNKDKN